MDPYLNSLHGNYHVDPSVLSSLESFLEGEKLTEYVCIRGHFISLLGNLLEFSLAGLPAL